MASRPSQEKIAIVGAGMGGLAAAIDLARRGLSVVVFERGGRQMDQSPYWWEGLDGSRVLAITARQYAQALEELADTACAHDHERTEQDVLLADGAVQP